MSYEVQLLLEKGAQLSSWITLSCATLLIYDHVTNLADEVEHFWTGSWTFSRIMYLCVGCGRYDTWVAHRQSLLSCFYWVFCALPYALLTYGIATASMPLCQFGITLRVWYMFAHNLFIRSITVGTYIACTVTSAVLAGISWPEVRRWIENPGLDRTSTVVWFFIPSMVFHSVSFSFKVYRFMTIPRYLPTDTFLWRFLQEGMVMYAYAIGSLLFIVIGLTMTDTSQIPMYESALNGGIVFVTLTIVSVCHAMLSIKSLAATLHVDPGWLLNHAELSRVHWRQGTTNGEIVVEAFDLPLMSPACGPAGMDVDSTLSMDSKNASGSSNYPHSGLSS